MFEWIPVDDTFDCSECDAMVKFPYEYCPKCNNKINYVRGDHGVLIPREIFIKSEFDK